MLMEDTGSKGNLWKALSDDQKQKIIERDSTLNNKWIYKYFG